MTPETPILETKNLKKYFEIDNGLFAKKDEFKAVDDINLKLYKNKTIGIIGESGCGKTTLARMIAGITNPTYGDIMFKGNTIFSSNSSEKENKARLKKVRKEIQMIFQDPYSSLNPRLTVGNIIAEGIKIHTNLTKKEIDNEVLSIMNLCGLNSADINKFPFQMSGGGRQRVGIAHSLALSPEIVICDEPTSALDVSIQSQILNLMVDIKKEKQLSYLFISHNLNAVKFICDEIIVMYLGQVVESGPCNEVYNSPLHPYTKALIASSPRTTLSDKPSPKMLLENDIAINNESQCKLYSRCIFRNNNCVNANIKMHNLENGHTVRCNNVNNAST